MSFDMEKSSGLDAIGSAFDAQTPSNTIFPGIEKEESSALDAVEAMEAEQLTTAYAMVKFRDSHCYITTPNLVIVRDVNFLQDWQAQEKERKRRAKAHEALQQYALEPSQPSQPGDDDRHDPSSGDSLVGRPESGLLSHYSEQGGPVVYALSDEEEEFRSTQRKRRLLRTLQNSSSTNSIAPQYLQANEGSEFLQTGQYYDSDGHPSDPLEWAQLPVHPPRPEDIKKISREHLIFSYNSDFERWELKIIGNRAFVNGTLYDKHDVVPLSHNDEIIIASLTMNFTLPDDLVREAEAESDAAGDEVIESVEAGSRASLSTERRVSDAFGDSEEEERESGGGEPKRSRIKLKLSLKKGKNGAKDGDRSKGKAKMRPDENPLTTSTSPEVQRKLSKARKQSDSTEAVKKEPSAISPPTLPLNLDPNSTLAGLAPDELPEKRKGPGRPPKNGLVSKRDEAIIRKKIKDREKRGLAIPEYRVLLEETRNENKQRDMANKAQACGEPVPNAPIPSIEDARVTDSGQLASQPPPDSTVQDTGGPAVRERKPSPKPRRVVRSPSPMKPMSAFTEEELKKPNMTYIYLLDEILQNVEGGQADLQTIYNKLQKRWPFFRYKAPSSGWQSSVRHNLLSCPRFIDVGKSGKGKLWVINHDHQLDKQKRKPSPPPARPPSHNMQNGQLVANGQGASQQWYGQPAYNGPFGQSNPNAHAPPHQAPQPGNGQYYSPYGPSQPIPPDNHLPAVPGPSTPMPHLRQPANGPFIRNGSHTPHPPHQPPRAHQHPPLPPPQAPIQPLPFQPVVDAIMNYRIEYLQRHPSGSDEYLRDEERFKKATNHFSNLFHANGDDVVEGEDLSQEPFSRILQIFKRYKKLFSIPQPNGMSATSSNTSQVNAGDIVGHGGGVAMPASLSSALQQPISVGPQATTTAPVAAPTALMTVPATQSSARAQDMLPIAQPQTTPLTPPNATQSIAPTVAAPVTHPPAPTTTEPSLVAQNHGGYAREDSKSADEARGRMKRAADEPVDTAETKQPRMEWASTVS